MSSKTPQKQNVTNGVGKDARLTPPPGPYSGGVSSSRGTKRKEEVETVGGVERSRPRLEMELRSSGSTSKETETKVAPQVAKVMLNLGNERPMTPTRLSRLEEKNTLVALNNRFAAIIDRNNKLENENAKLAAQVETVEKTLAKTTESLRNTYQTESGSSRAKLEHAEKEKAKAELALNSLKNSLNDSNTKVQSLKNENGELKKQLELAEADTSKAEAELKKQNSENGKLKKALDELTRELKKLEADNLSLRKTLEEKTLRIVELDNALKGKSEELQIKAHVHEQEVSTIRTANQSKIAEMGGKLQQEYDSRLEEAIRQLRDDCQKELQSHKQERENLYQMKEKDFKTQLENNSSQIKSKMDEMARLFMSVEELNKKMTLLDGERYALAGDLQKTREAMKKDKEDFTRALQDLEKRIRQLQSDKDQLINEYQDLMEVKVALDNEIATYRKLLEGEEMRLDMFSAIGKNLKKGGSLEDQIMHPQPVAAKAK